MCWRPKFSNFFKQFSHSGWVWHDFLEGFRNFGGGIWTPQTPPLGTPLAQWEAYWLSGGPEIEKTESFHIYFPSPCSSRLAQWLEFDWRKWNLRSKDSWFGTDCGTWLDSTGICWCECIPACTYYKGAQPPTYSSLVQYSPVRLIKTRQRLFTFVAIAAAGIEQSRVQSSPVESNESCRVKKVDTPRFFFVSRTPATGSDGWYFESRNEWRIFLSPPHPQCHQLSSCGFCDPPSRAWQKCNRLLRLGRPWGAVTLSRRCVSGDRGGCSARRGQHLQCGFQVFLLSLSMGYHKDDTHSKCDWFRAHFDEGQISRVLSHENEN